VTETLAIDGGTPVRDTFLPYATQWIGPDEEARVLQVLRSEWITTGPVTKEFEEAFARYVGAKHAVSCHSGTAALHLSMGALGIDPGDEVITTPFTFAATSNAVLFRGGTPVFADIQEDTRNLDPGAAAGAITRKTKAIVPVHFGGHPCDMDELRKLAKDHSLAVVEDAAHALSAEYRGRRIGGTDGLAVFSFHPVKNITTGEGGMVTTNSGELAERVRALRAHGVMTDPDARFGPRGSYFYEMRLLGHRFYMTDMQAALGIAQLGRLESFQRRRREIVALYERELGGVEGIRLPVSRSEVLHAWHLYVIELTGPGLDRDWAFKAMRAENIGVNVHYIPVHYHPYYRERFGDRKGRFPRAERAYERVLTLPLFPRMTDEDAMDVVRALRKVMDVWRPRARVRHRSG